MNLGILFNIELLNKCKRKSFQVDFQEHPELSHKKNQNKFINRIKKMINIEYGYFVYDLGIVFYNKSVEKRASAAQLSCAQYEGNAIMNDKKKWQCVQYINDLLELKCKITDFKVKDNFRIMFFVVKSDVSYMFMAQMCSKESQKESLLLQLYSYKRLLKTFDADALKMVCTCKNGIETIVLSMFDIKVDT